MADTCPTVKIVATAPDEQGPFVVINESDFNPKQHTLWVKSPEAEPKVRKSKGGDQ